MGIEQARPIPTVYSRANCHLLTSLRELRARFASDIRIVDVDSDAAPAALYGLHVPVLAHDGRGLCRHRIEPAYLGRLRIASDPGPISLSPTV